MTSIITVKFSSFSQTELKSVIDHYNSIKPSHCECIAELNRCEGGFQIPLNETERLVAALALSGPEENDRIKQLRWNRRKLDPLNFNGFNQEETLLLYRALVHVFTESLVVLGNPL
jgi:hypothetical protein